MEPVRHQPSTYYSLAIPARRLADPGLFVQSLPVPEPLRLPGRGTFEAGTPGPSLSPAAQGSAARNTPARLAGPEEMRPEERSFLQMLRHRDQEVRAHEAAHVAAGGPYIRGGANFVFQNGPDGRLYAIGGEVSIDTSPVPNDPRATILKMQTVRRAALAPSQPSGADMTVASTASQRELQARLELARLRDRGEEIPWGRHLNLAA